MRTRQALTSPKRVIDANGVTKTYLSTRPSTVPEGMVLVHNHILPIKPRERIGTRGFRIWLESPSDRLAECPCGFAPRLGTHYRLAAKFKAA
jgi:hypothetical protein